MTARWSVVALASCLAGQARAEPLQCVKHWPEVRYTGAGYDHWVHLESSCPAEVGCRVATNVNPNPIHVDVASGEHVAVLTWRGSPAREFMAAVECRPSQSSSENAQR